MVVHYYYAVEKYLMSLPTYKRFVNEVMSYPYNDFPRVPTCTFVNVCLDQKVSLCLFFYLRATLVVCSSKHPSHHHQL